MEMIDIVIILAIALIIGGALAYIIKAKRSGKKCIGCPYSTICGKGGCSGNCSGTSCGCTDNISDADEE